MQIRRTALAFTSAAALSLGGVALAAPASAAPPVDQDGLINLNLQDVNVQAPIAVAANVCGLSVNLLAQQLGQGPVDCTALAEGTATRGGGGSGGPVQQNGLVNINVTDINVQLPISAAVNVCGVGVNVLATVVLPPGPVDCEAIAEAVATG